MAEQLELPTYERTYSRRHVLPKKLSMETGFMRDALTRELLATAWFDGHYVFDVHVTTFEGSVLEGTHDHTFIDVVALARKQGS